MFTFIPSRGFFPLTNISRKGSVIIDDDGTRCFDIFLGLLMLILFYLTCIVEAIIFWIVSKSSECYLEYGLEFWLTLKRSWLAFEKSSLSFRILIICEDPVGELLFNKSILLDLLCQLFRVSSTNFCFASLFLMAYTYNGYYCSGLS